MTDSQAPKATVEVSARLVWVAGGALVVCLVGIGYFVGRESGRASVDRAAPPPQMAAPPSAPPAVAPRVAAPRRAPPTPSSTPVGPAPAGTAPAPLPMRPAPVPAPPVAPLSGAPPTSPQRDAVARYFEALDAIGAEGGLATNDPESLAMAILSQATTGDATAFDRLTAAQRSSLAAMRRVRPPDQAREHHRRTVVLLEESSRLLSRLKQGLLDGNIAALGELSSQANRMKTQAEDLQRLADQIKQQSGLVP